jgi:L-rhamnose mutarotase
MPERIAFRMSLHPGQAAEYEKRHDEIFPGLVEALKDAGVSDYSIWLDPEDHHLFGILTRSDNHKLNKLPDTEIMKRGGPSCATSWIAIPTARQFRFR